ncbi:MAG: AAA family ATPase [Muribaculaceae bacterium]|nr:AAA family ATPase [Muribaculaceae bacterium]
MTKHIPYIRPIASTQREVIEFLSRKPSGLTFVHGKAGSGKTYLIRKIESAIAGCQVLAPTNLAASLYRNGRTLHSFFHKGFDDINEGFMDPANINPMKADLMHHILSGVTMIVIDEISMVRSDTFEMMHRLCQEALGNHLPFGGIPVIIVGDLFQLPPIVSDPATYDYLKNEYGGVYFFDSHVIRDNIDSIRLFELEKSFRHQGNPRFTELLDAFRAPLTPEKKVRLLEEFNTRVSYSLPSDAVYIASSNEQVACINAERLDRLPGKKTTLEACYRILLRGTDTHVDIKHGNLPSDLDIEPIVLPSAFDGELSFKTGARVMITKSNRYFGFCNGDFGTIAGFDGASFTIHLDNGRCVMLPHPNDKYKRNLMTEYRYEMVYNADQHKLARKKPYIQSTTQYPVKLAYAFTIHKSQGQTYDKVIIDLNSHIFAPGQLYVALSRAKSLDGLFLTKKITYSDIISDDSIFRFLNELRIANGANAVDSLSLQASSTQNGSVSNPRCDDFISFVRMNERNDSVKDFLCHTLESYRSVFALGENDLAMEELIKVIDLVNSSYITDRYDNMLLSMRTKQPTSEDCRYNLNAIFEIYTDVIRLPRQQFSSDNKYLPKQE